MYGERLDGTWGKNEKKGARASRVFRGDGFPQVSSS